MSRIRPVLFTKSESGQHGLSLAIVDHWIEDLRGIPYGFTQEWKTPSEVESGSAADCKGKAVALYQRMQAHGAENVRLVIGKCTVTSRKMACVARVDHRSNDQLGGLPGESGWQSTLTFLCMLTLAPENIALYCSPLRGQLCLFQYGEQTSTNVACISRFNEIERDRKSVMRKKICVAKRRQA